MTKLNNRDEVKALDLAAIFDAAIRGEDTVFTHSDEDTFTFAKQRARTATQRLSDGEGNRFSGRISILTDPTTLTLTYSSKGGSTERAPAARRRVERKEAEVKRTGVVIETRNLVGSTKPLPDGAYSVEDESFVDGQVIYGCQPGCKLSVGPAAAKGDDIKCSYCGRTNESSAIEFGGAVTLDGEEILPTPTIQPLYRFDEGRAVSIGRSLRRKTSRQVREGDIGAAASNAAHKERKARRKKDRASLSRRRSR